MTVGDIQALEVQIPREIIQYWGWFLAFGIGVLVLGIAAVVRAVAATVVSMLFFGWLLVLASGIEIAQAVMGALGGFLSTSDGSYPVWHRGYTAGNATGEKR